MQGWVAVVSLLAFVVLAASAQAQEEDENYWKRITNPEQTQSESRIREGKEAFQDGLYAKALSSFEEALLLTPENEEAYLFAIFSASEAGQVERALALLQRLRQLSAESEAKYQLCFTASILYAKLERWQDGVDEAERCMERFPQAKQGLLSNAAELLMADAQLDKAVDYYRAALDLDPYSVHSVFGLAVALERSGQREESQRYLLRGLQIDSSVSFMFSPNTFFTPAGEEHFHLALMYRALGRYEEARVRLALYLESAPRQDYADLAKRILDELSSLKSPRIDSYPLPERDVSAAVVDTKLRWLALGTAGGRLSVVKVGSSENWDLSLSGPAILDLAFTSEGKELRALLDSGEVLRFETKKGFAQKGSFKLADWAALGGLSADGSSAIIATDAITLHALGTDEEAVVFAQSYEPSSTPVLAATPDRTVLLQGWTLSSVKDKQVTGELLLGGRLLSSESSADGALMVLGKSDGVVLTGVDATVQRVIMPSEDQRARAVGLDPSSRYLTVVLGATVELWDLSAFER
jgi:tetratricopeptide (TPR) repeat protein